MEKYKKLLVAFDGSDSSKNALVQAINLVNGDNTRITVASIILPYDGDIDLICVKDIREAMRRSCESIISEAKKLADDSMKTICEEGEVHERIIELANTEGCDLIVMGRRVLRRLPEVLPLERVLVGSVTARVIGHSNKDVLVIPQGATIKWKNILLATDGSKYSDAAANKAISLAKSYNGELKILSVVDIPTEFYAESPKAAEELTNKAKGIIENVSRQAELSNVKSSGFVREGNASEVITEFALKEKVVAPLAADIIVMGSHGRTGLMRLLMGSVAERVIGHASCPVLVIKA